MGRDPRYQLSPAPPSSSSCPRCFFRVASHPSILRICRWRRRSRLTAHRRSLEVDPGARQSSAPVAKFHHATAPS